MKKQLIAAAVAATMSSVSMADISMSGSYEAVFSDTGSVTDELDLKIVGKSGASTVTIALNDIQDTDFNNASNQVYLTTTVEGLTVKAGDWKGLTGNGLTFKKGAASDNKIEVSTSVAGVKVAAASNDTVTVAGDFAGVSVKVQDALNSSRTTSIATDIAGIALTAEENDNTTAFSLSGSVAGMKVTYASIDATAGTATQDDGILGDITGKTNVTGLNIQADTAMGPVTVKAQRSDSASVNTIKLVRNGVAYGYNDSTEAFSAKVAFNF